MSSQQHSIALVTDHILTNCQIARGLDESRFVLHSLASDDLDLTAKLAELDPALIFVRASLKSGSGFELCSRIKDQAALQNAHIVFLSQDEANREKAIEHRACQFLMMPVSQQAIAETVDRFVERHRTILFADDSKLQHEIVVPHLRGEGFEVVEAWNGQEALGIFEHQEIDLLITDLEMPKMDGFSLCRSVKTCKRESILPVLICSSLDSDQEVRRGFEAGADDYIVKPIVVSELLSRVKRLLPSVGPKRPERILVTDDSGIVRRMIVQALEAQGLQVEEAENGFEAFEKVQEGHYDLVTVDYEMPVMNGYDFCMKVRTDNELGDLPIVMVSSRESQADEVRVKSTGIQAFVTKPFKAERLIAEVERVLAEARLLRQRKSMRLYLSDSAADAVDRISEHSREVDISPRDEFRTVFFSDICSFTPLCEKLPAREVVELLNSYFDHMVEKLIKYDAVIDKFIGDAIMALFDLEADGAHRAVCAASEMIEALPELRENLGADLHIRIGLNSGYVVMGDIGSEARRDFTVIGNSVNVAQRLESNAETDRILVSEETYKLVEGLIDAEPTEPFPMKGKSGLVRGYHIKAVQPYSVCSS